MYTYDQLKKSDQTLQKVEKEQKKIKSELNEIPSSSRESEIQKKIRQRMLRIFKILDKKLLIYLMIIQELDLEPFTKQIKKLQGQKIITPKQML